MTKVLLSPNPEAARIQAAITLLTEQLIRVLIDAPTDPPTPPWLSIVDFARRIGQSERTVRRMLAEGMPSEPVRRRVRRIPVARAEAWIAQQREAEHAASLDGTGESVR